MDELLARADLAPTCNLANSFVPGTPVLLADGTRRPIEDVRLGELVVATDPGTGVTAARPVTRLITGTGDKTLVDVVVDVDGPLGDRTEVLTATARHPFWAPDRAAWVDADRLAPRTRLRTDAGRTVQVVSTRTYRAAATVHNLTVADLHTYYVSAGTTAVLVHNCGGLDDLARMRQGLGAPPGDSVVLSRLDVGGQQFYGISGHGQVNPRPAGVTPQSMTHAEGDAFGQAARAQAAGGNATLYVDGLVPCRYCRSSLAGYAKDLNLDTLTVVGPNGYLGQYVRGGGYRTLRESV
ncbi:hypothetical protein LDL48_34700 [Wangella sp. NEAU-J3]|nr:hypothetical protein [Jidongwangia harbinensis]